jgi:hypothetical protein
MQNIIVSTTPTGKYRSSLPDLQSGKFKQLPYHDSHTWAEEFYKNPFAKELTKIWLELWNQPYKGLTTDGRFNCNDCFCRIGHN